MNVNATNSDRTFMNIIKPVSERYINNKMNEGKCTVLYHCISSRCEYAVLSNRRNVVMGGVWLILWCYSRSFLMNQQETMQISAKIAKTQSQELNFELLKTLRDSQ